MRLAILGGGGFRVPLVYGALLRDTSERPGRPRSSLHDVDAGRLAAVGARAGRSMAAGRDPTRRAVADHHRPRRRRCAGADFVFSAIRVGGLAGPHRRRAGGARPGRARPGDHRPGRPGLRAAHGAGRRRGRRAGRARSPRDAWVINFTNPAGMITEAMQRVLGDRVVGICDSPIGLGRRAARALGLDPDRTSARLRRASTTWAGCAGSSHDGGDVLPDLLGRRRRCSARIEEGRLFGADWLRALGALPNEYLYYYYFTRDAVASIRRQRADPRRVPARPAARLLRRGAPPTRARPSGSGSRVRARARRHVHGGGRATHEDEERDAGDVEGGGYEGVALAIMAAIARDERAAMILNVRNGTDPAGLPRRGGGRGALHVDADGAAPARRRPLAGPPCSAWCSRSRRSSS